MEIAGAGAGAHVGSAGGFGGGDRVTLIEVVGQVVAVEAEGHFGLGREFIQFKFPEGAERNVARDEHADAHRRGMTVDHPMAREGGLAGAQVERGGERFARTGDGLAGAELMRADP